MKTNRWTAIVAVTALLWAVGCGDAGDAPGAANGAAPDAVRDASGAVADAERGDAPAAGDTAATDAQGLDVAPTCARDGWCVPGCDDPDCGGLCACDSAAICEAAAPGSTAACECDADCAGRTACGGDGACDTWCPTDVDPDCTAGECPCAVRAGVCETAGPGDATACPCDPDCAGGTPCAGDGACDDWCPAGADPDCAPACGCARNAGVCDAGESGTTTCACDPDCAGGGTACGADAVCDAWCAPDADPDCGCACDDRAGVCEPHEVGSTLPCGCDADCAGLAFACRSDGTCDPRCPEGNDVDCGTCGCDYNAGICEPARKPTTEPCACDPTCLDGGQPCAAEGHCDTWCPAGVDPDC